MTAAAGGDPMNETQARVAIHKGWQNAVNFAVFIAAVVTTIALFR